MESMEGSVELASLTDVMKVATRKVFYVLVQLLKGSVLLELRRKGNG